MDGESGIFEPAEQKQVARDAEREQREGPALLRCELTAEHGLVTCELVPALVSIDGDQRVGGTALARYRY